MTNQALTAAPQEKPWIEYYTFSQRWYPKGEAEYLKSHTITKVGAVFGRAIVDFLKLLGNFLISIPNAIVWTGRHICCCSPRKESQSVADLSTPDDLSPTPPTGTIANLNKDDEDSTAANPPQTHTNNHDMPTETNETGTYEEDMGAGSTPSTRHTTSEAFKEVNGKFNEYSDDGSEGTPTNQGVQHKHVPTPRPVPPPPMALTFHHVHHRKSPAPRVSTPIVAGNGSFSFVSNNSLTEQPKVITTVSTSNTSPNTTSPFSSNTNVFVINSETPPLVLQSPIELTSQTAAAPHNSVNIPTASENSALTVEIPRDVSDASLSPQHSPLHNALIVKALAPSNSPRSPVILNSMLMQQSLTLANVTSTLAPALTPQQEDESALNEDSSSSHSSADESASPPTIDIDASFGLGGTVPSLDQVPEVTLTHAELDEFLNMTF